MFNGDALSRSQELEYARKAAHGDHDAFRHLVLAYETSILMYLQSILGDWESARDLAQETFIAAFYALPRWQAPESLNRWQSIPQKNGQGARSLVDHPLAPWLYRIATNHALTFLKQQGRYKRAGASLPLEYHPDINQISESMGESQGAVEGWEGEGGARWQLTPLKQRLAEPHPEGGGFYEFSIDQHLFPDVIWSGPWTGMVGPSQYSMISLFKNAAGTRYIFFEIDYAGKIMVITRERCIQLTGERACQ